MIAESAIRTATSSTRSPNSRLPFGLRTVDGSFNNLVQDQTHFGASDQNFPLLLDQVFRNDLDGDTFDQWRRPDGVRSPTPTTPAPPTSSMRIRASSPT